MKIGKRAYQVLKEISFERLGGTDEEFKALNILKREVESEGIECQIEEFEIDAYKIEEAEFVVTSPKNKKYNVTGYGMSGSTPAEGITAEVMYVESTKMISQLDLEGKIAILSQPLGYQLYEDLVKAKVSGIISSSGSVYDELSKTDLEERTLRERHFKNGKIPCFTIRMRDLEKLILSNPKEAYIKLTQTETKAKSHNLVATIPGESKEVVCFTAHYDSVRFSTGAYDNGTGSVTILEALRYFAAHKPKRTLKFVWCGSEEKGLLGSHAYVNQHKDELEDYKLNINVDMTGVVLGKDIAVCTSEMSLPNYIEYFAKTIGFVIETSQGVYSSDSTPFAYNNVPAISFARISSRGGAEIHSRKDVIDYISPEYLEKTIVFINQFAENVINSVYFPVPKTMPQNMKDELDKYLGNKKDVK